MKGLIGVIVLVAAVALPAAGAARAEIDSELYVAPFDLNPGDEKLLMSGRVISNKQKCVGNRKVAGIIGEKGDLETQDTAKTSAEGGFGLLTEDDGPIYRVKLFSKNVGGDLCKGAVYTAS